MGSVRALRARESGVGASFARGVGGGLPERACKISARVLLLRASLLYGKGTGLAPGRPQAALGLAL